MDWAQSSAGREFTGWRKLLVWCNGAFLHNFLPALARTSLSSPGPAQAPGFGSSTWHYTSPSGHRGQLSPEQPRHCHQGPGCCCPTRGLEIKPWLWHHHTSNTPPAPHVVSRITDWASLGVSQSATRLKIKPVLKCFMGLGPEYRVSCRIEPCVFTSIILAQSFCQANLFSLSFVYFSGLNSLKGGG